MVDPAHPFWGGVILYLWIGIAVFLFQMARRLLKVLRKGGNFLPSADLGSPLATFDQNELAIAFLAICLVAWPAVLYINWFWPKGK